MFAKFIPLLIQMYQSGEFPVNELCQTYPVSEIHESIEDMKSGKVRTHLRTSKQTIANSWKGHKASTSLVTTHILI